MSNLDSRTVKAFGTEWARFDQSRLSHEELHRQFSQYFHIFPWSALPPDPVGFDLGCGSGRWAWCVAPRVDQLHCIDASVDAIHVAQANLRDADNCTFHVASVDAMPLPNASMDFGYSLGVLHHVPDTAAGIHSCAMKLKPGAPLLLYLYYALDTRPAWFKAIWRASDAVRRVVARLPYAGKLAVSTVLAVLVYFPAARVALLAERVGLSVDSFPLAPYRDRSFYSMRTDALDRFGTRLEHRFTAAEIERMMRAAGLERIEFSPEVPFWCVVGYRAATGDSTV